MIGCVHLDSSSQSNLLDTDTRRHTGTRTDRRTHRGQGGQRHIITRL